MPPITPLTKDDPLVLSFAQQRLWFLSQLEGRSATYNMPAALRLSGRLNETALQRALAALIGRHESLRICFPAINGEATRQLNDVYDPLSLTDLRNLPEAEQQERANEWIAERILSEPEQQISELPLATKAEQEQLQAWNQTDADGFSLEADFGWGKHATQGVEIIPVPGSHHSMVK